MRFIGLVDIVKVNNDASLLLSTTVTLQCIKSEYDPPLTTDVTIETVGISLEDAKISVLTLSSIIQKNIHKEWADSAPYIEISRDTKIQYQTTWRCIMECCNSFAPRLERLIADKGYI